MTADFYDAAQRHWEDATLLLDAQRLANADQLFGLSAECSLKAVMQGLGMALRADGAPAERRYREHIDKLWDEFLTFAAGRGGARYADVLDAVQNPFEQWSVGQRYAPRSAFTAAQVAQYQAGAALARRCLGMAEMDGVI